MTKVKIVIVLLFTFILSGITYAVGIKGKVENVGSEKNIYIYEYFGEVLLKSDSTKVEKNGSFTFQTKYPRGLYRIGFTEDSSAILILGEDNIEITTKTPGFQKHLKIHNSIENNLFKDFSQQLELFGLQVDKLQKKYEQSAQSGQENPELYNKTVARLRSQYDSLTKVKNKNFKAIQQKAPGTFVAKIADVYITPDTLNPTNYFKKTDFTDVELTRGDMLSYKIKNYFQLFVQPQEQAFSSAINDLLLKLAPNSPNREVAFISLLSLFNQFQSPLNKQIKIQYKEEYPNSKYAKAFLPTLKQDAPDVGDLAPNIVMKDTAGKSISLASLRGKVVLLDFWASWCGPCRMENPNVVRAFNKYKDKGFTIYSVSLDNSREKWLGAIKKDNLTWTHVSELKGWETSASRLYQVSGIPATYLIDKEGKIVARNLRGPALDEMLDKVLGK